MPTSISSKSLTLDDFQKFSEQSTTSDTAVVGKKLIGSGLKTISSLGFQSASGGTSAIVDDFQKALRQKYGDEIADFVFSTDNKQAALAQGLNKKTIAAVLKKAKAIQESPLKDDFFSYRAAIGSKQRAVEKTITQLKGTERKKAEQKYDSIKKTWKDCADVFDDWCSSNSEKTAATFKKYFQKNLYVVDQLARAIIPGTAKVIPDTVDILQKDTGLSEKEARKSVVLLKQRLGERLSRELMETASAQHSSIHRMNNMAKEMVEVVQEATNSLALSPRNSTTTTDSKGDVIPDPAEAAFTDIPDSAELEALYSKHPQLKQFLENLSLIPETLQANTDRLNEQLRPFISLSTTVAPENYFYLSNNPSQTVAIHSPQTESSSSTTEQQQAAAQRFFSALKEFYGAKLIDAILSVDQQQLPLTVQKTREVLNTINDTLQEVSHLPIIITPEYLVALANNKEAATAARKSHDQLGPEGNALVRTLREIGICGMILSGTKIGLAVAGVSTATPACIILALTAAAADGYIVGRLVTREGGLSAEVQHEAGTISAISTTGSAVGLIISNSIGGGELLATAAEYGGSYLALYLQEAARGGARAAQLEEHSNVDGMTHRAADEISLESRLVRFFGLESYVNRLLTSMGTLGGLINSSPSVAAISAAAPTSSAIG